MDKLRDERVIKKIADLYTIGLTPNQISEELARSFNFEDDPSPQVVKSMVKQYSIRGTEFLRSDKDISEKYKKALSKLLDESMKNVETTSALREELVGMMGLIEAKAIVEGEGDSRKFFILLKEIQNVIRTMDNSISTQKGVLELIEKQKKDFQMSALQNTEMTMQQLEEMEKEGLIALNPKLKKLKKKREEAQ